MVAGGGVSTKIAFKTGFVGCQLFAPVLGTTVSGSVIVQFYTTNETIQSGWLRGGTNGTITY